MIPDIFEGLDIASREQVGFIMAVNADNQASRAAKGQEVQIPLYGAETASDINPGVTPPNDGDATTAPTSLILDNARRVPVRISGEDTVGLNHGNGASSYIAGRFAQGFRTMTNEVEASLALKAFSASRAIGTAGTTPFASSLSDSAQLLKVLKDNGANGDLRMVVDTSTGANLRSLTQLTKANEAGTDEALRTGTILDVNGFRIGESGAADELSHTKGGGTSYLLNDATSAVGDTTIAVDTGSGTILAGDVVVFAGDTNKYIVATALATGSFTIALPGLRVALEDNAAVTVGNSYSANVGFVRSAFHMASRPPARPAQGDLAIDVQMVTDPFSGLTFEVSVYEQYRQIQFEIGLVWGSKVIKPAHMAMLLG
tara:strand:+ start:5079 stop:6194 length:1116 start_codon:yes stop_codon:yes gene_type:complete